MEYDFVEIFPVMVKGHRLMNNYQMIETHRRFMRLRRDRQNQLSDSSACLIGSWADHAPRWLRFMRINDTWPVVPRSPPDMMRFGLIHWTRSRQTNPNQSNPIQSETIPTCGCPRRMTAFVRRHRFVFFIYFFVGLFLCVFDSRLWLYK